MPLLVTTPENKDFIQRIGTYRKTINLLSRKETAVQRAVRRSGLGGYEPHLQAALLGLCELPSRRIIFYDVGAHIGIFSALIGTVMKHKSPGIFAFEPTPRTACLCRELRDANDLAYPVHQLAVGNTTGTFNLHISPKSESSNSLNPSFRDAIETVPSRMITLDSFVAEGNPPPTTIKVDVETLEPEVISGARSVIETHRPHITCEFLTPDEGGRDITHVASYLYKLDYCICRIEDTTPYSEFSPEDVMANLTSDRRDWLLSPREKINDGFYEVVKEWKNAIAACGADTTSLVEAGNWSRKALTENW